MAVSYTHLAYTQVKAHMTHHVEAIFVDYDADMVSYVDLCKLFFEIHDPCLLYTSLELSSTKEENTRTVADTHLNSTGHQQMQRESVWQ